jgi:hypothetical protein
MLMIYLHTEFYLPSFKVSLVVAIISKGKHIFLAVAMLLCIIKKYLKIMHIFEAPLPRTTSGLCIKWS